LQDIRDGNALFLSEAEGSIIGEAPTIEVPQYALLVDSRTKRRTRVVVLQAERARGIEMVGCLDLATGTYGAATLPEFELLGRAPISK